MSSRGHMYRNKSTQFLSASLLAACSSGGDPGGGPIDLGTSTGSPISTTTETPTTSVPTTSATSSTSTGAADSSSSSGTSTGGATTGGTSGSTTDNPSPLCGDGNLDPGEECDLSAANNNDNGACTLECKAAKCGDKLVWTGQEACDDGPNNNDSLYGGCTTKCEFGPRCSDGKLQAPEECDLGADNGDDEFPADSVPCDESCRFDAKLVFLSSVAYKGGDLKGDAPSGAEGAHQKCQALAGAASFDNAVNFKAWISDAQHSPAKDFTKTPGKPYVRPDGVRIADDWNDLIANGPADGIIITEAGTKLLNWGVWTGTAANGQLHPDTVTCKGWTSSAPADKGIRGLNGVEKQQEAAWMQWVESKQWTNYASLSCLGAFHIYCFEQ